MGWMSSSQLTGLHGATNVFRLSFKIGNAINNLSVSCSAAVLRFLRSLMWYCMTADWQTVSHRLYIPERVESRQKRLRAQTGNITFWEFYHFIVCLLQENRECHNGDAVRQAISNEGKKLPVVISVPAFFRPLLWQANKTYNLPGSRIFPLLTIQKYSMCINGEEEKKNKLFLSGKVTHAIIIELF